MSVSFKRVVTVGLFACGVITLTASRGFAQDSGVTLAQGARRGHCHRLSSDGWRNTQRIKLRAR